MLAIEKHATRLRDDAEQREADRARMMQEYSSLMLADPDANAERIAELMFDLDLSPEQVEADARAVTEARRLQGLAANRDAAKSEYTGELDRTSAMKFVAEQRERFDKHYRQVQARNYADACKHAIDELAALAAEHPHLFNVADEVPRLHGDDVSMQATETLAARKLEASQSRLMAVEKELRLATSKLEQDLTKSVRCGWQAWKTELQRQQRQLVKQLDATPADATDGDADEE